MGNLASRAVVAGTRKGDLPGEARERNAALRSFSGGRFHLAYPHVVSTYVHGFPSLSLDAIPSAPLGTPVASSGRKIEDEEEMEEKERKRIDKKEKERHRHKKKEEERKRKKKKEKERKRKKKEEKERKRKKKKEKHRKRKKGSQKANGSVSPTNSGHRQGKSIRHFC